MGCSGPQNSKMGKSPGLKFKKGETRKVVIGEVGPDPLMCKIR